MQTPEELDKIRREENDLSAKLLSLEYFMMTEDFIKVSPEQKTLLEQQHKVMTEYKFILIKRAHRINWEAGRDKAAAEIKEAITNPEEREHGCAGCRHAEYYPEDKGKPTCGNPRADGKTCWEAMEKRLEPHVFAAMEYEAWKKKSAEEKDCKDCANSIDEKICTGDKEHGWVDTTGEKKCFAPKEPDFPQCPYNNTGDHRFCIARVKNLCTSSGSYCFKQGMELKERENGTQSDK